MFLLEIRAGPAGFEPALGAPQAPVLSKLYDGPSSRFKNHNFKRLAQPHRLAVKDTALWWSERWRFSLTFLRKEAVAPVRIRLGLFNMSTLNDISGLAGNPICAFAALAFLLIGKTTQFLQIALALLIVYAIVIPIRYVWFKPRPKPMRWNTFLERFEANSLVSVHTARATILAFVFSMYFGQIGVGILFAALIPLVAASRILLQKHRLEDLILGFLVGAGVSLLVLTLI